jgi:hypothetical protein
MKKSLLTALFVSSLITSLQAVPVYEPFADATASGGSDYAVGAKLGFDTSLTG